jgi:hypothetical protein
MELQSEQIEHVPALVEASRLADLIEEGNELLNKAKEVARRIEERCFNAVQTNPIIRDWSPSGSD